MFVPFKLLPNFFLLVRGFIIQTATANDFKEQKKFKINLLFIGSFFI